MENEYDKKYTWVIKNFSSLKCEKIYSSQFVAGGCKWRFRVNPKKFRGSNCLAVFLGVADFESLPLGWRRHAKFRLTIVNQLEKKNSATIEEQNWFEQKIHSWGFGDMLLLDELHDKDSGFLVNGELIVVAEIKVLEVIGKLDFTEEETSPVMESMVFNEFEVLSSQVASVKRLFDRHPNIASNFRPNNSFLKTAYIGLLLGVTKTLNQSPLEVSKSDLADASAAIISLQVAGFKLDWLEKKLEEIKENRERTMVVGTRMHEINGKLKDLKDQEVQLEKEKANILTNSASLKLDDVF